jgi:hypothetical protein
MPPEYYDDEWQARQREKTKELRRMQREEEEEEERVFVLFQSFKFMRIETSPSLLFMQNSHDSVTLLNFFYLYSIQ